MYGNEEGVGEAIRASGIPRDELYVTTKLNNGFHRARRRPPRVRRSRSTELGLDHVDLFLIHWPLPTRYDGDFVSTWRTLTEFHADGRARSIGVSNFQPAHLGRSSTRPASCRRSTRSRCTRTSPTRPPAPPTLEHGIATEAWSPIAQGEVPTTRTIDEIAERVGRTPAQVALRWHIQRGDIVFPKSMHAERMRGELRDLRLRAHPTTTCGASARSTAARTAAPARTRTQFDYIPG